LSHLIDNFLAFSRIERDKYAFDFHPCRPVKLWTAPPPPCATASTRRAAVSRSPPRRICRLSWPIRGDGHGAGQSAGQRLEVFGRGKTNRADGRAANGGVTFAVQDNGIGLPAGKAAAFSNAFTRLTRIFRASGRGAAWA